MLQYRKLSDEGRERIRQLWLRHGSQWALIRREAEHDSIVSSWLAGRSRKQAQVRRGVVGGPSLAIYRGRLQLACLVLAADNGSSIAHESLTWSSLQEAITTVARKWERAARQQERH